MKDDTYQTVMMKGLTVTGTMVLDPATTQFRCVMLDQSTGMLGSVDVPIARLKEVNSTAAPPAPAAPGASPPEKPKP